MRFIMGILVLAVFTAVIAVLFAGPIAKYFLQKYDTQWIGREMEVDALHIYLLNGWVKASDIVFFEADGKNEFLTADHLNGKVRLWPLVSKRVEIDTLFLGHPVCGIIQDGDDFNWDDLVAFYSSDDEMPAPPDDGSSWEVNIRKIHLDEGEVSYANTGLNDNYRINQLEFLSPGFSSEHGLIPFRGGFNFVDVGGHLRIRGSYDYKSLVYDTRIAIDTVGLDLFYPYLTEYLKVDELGGRMSIYTRIKGDFDGEIDYMGKGYVLMDQFKLISEEQDSVAAFNILVMELDSFNSAEKLMRITQLAMDQPYIHFARYPQGDNFTALLKHESEEADTILSSTSGSIVPGQDYFNVFIYLGEYARYLAREYVRSDYVAERIELQNGAIDFEDYTLEDNATFKLREIRMSTSKFDNDDAYANFDLSTVINQNAEFTAKWKVNPKDILDMDLDYRLHGLSITSLSPYCYFYTGYPLSHGEVLLEGDVHIHDRKVKSDNYLYLEDVFVDKKQFDNPPYKVPVRLAVALLRNLEGDVRLKIPVSGSLDDPNFHYWRVIWKVLQNLLVKAAVAPVRLLASAFEVDEESLREIPFAYGETTISRESARRLKHLGKVMKGKEEMVLGYYQQGNAELEKDNIAVDFCRKLYMEEKGLDPAQLTDKNAPVELALRDSLFSSFILENSPLERKLASSQEHCRTMYGQDSLDALYPQLARGRLRAFQSYLTDSLGISPERIRPWQPDSAAVMDTLFLVRPTFLLHFDVAESDSTFGKPAEPEVSR